MSDPIKSEARPPQSSATTLAEELDKPLCRISHTLMQTCKAATQTYYAMKSVASSETFVAVQKIAAVANLPVATVRKHLAKLADQGFIENLGRQRTAGGRPRRTCTRKIITARDHYGLLPTWAVCLRRWPEQAVLSIVLAQYAKVRATADDEGWDASDWMENFSANRCWDFSLSDLQYTTGLSRHSVIEARRNLIDCLGLLQSYGESNLWPALYCQIIVRTQPDGFRRLYTNQLG